MKPRSIVPCGDCKICCTGEAIILHPEAGDDIASYITEPCTNPITGAAATRLQHRPNGECIYLGESGCTIWNRAPAICREFDCRGLFLRYPRDVRRRMLRAGILDKATLEAGRARLDWTALRLRQVQRWVNRHLWRKTKFEDYDASAKTSRRPLPLNPPSVSGQQPGEND